CGTRPSVAAFLKKGRTSSAAAVRCSRAVTPAFCARGGGRVVGLVPAVARGENRGSEHGCPLDPIILLDFAGVAVFAATGALAASRKQLDLIGFLFLASATGIGGGTVRDLVLGVPVFWVE